MIGKNTRRVFPFTVLCLIVLVAVVVAQQSLRPEVKLALTGLVQRGQEKLPVEKAGKVNPGEIVSYTITAANTGSSPARDLKPSAIIPNGTILIAGSAQAEGNAQVVYSIDGGKTFHAIPLIEQKQPDGSLKKIPAPVSMYTQVRYEWHDPLAPGQTFSASYKVRVR